MKMAAHRGPGIPTPNLSKTLAYLFATGGLLGLTAVLAGLALRSGWHPVTFLFWAGLGGGLVLLLTAVAGGQRLTASPQFVVYALVSGLLSFALPNILSLSAIPHVGAGFIALCLAFPPLLTYALALVFGLERFSGRGGAGMVVGLAGALLLALARPGGGQGAWVWTALALAAPAIISVGNIYRTAAWPAGASPRILAPLMLLAGAVMIGAYGLVVGLPFAPATWSLPAMLLLIVQTAVIAATYALYFVLQKLSGPVGLSQIGWIGAAVGKLLAVAFLAETIPALLPLAFALILTGVWMVGRRGA